jgi:hypothetical protein
MPEAMTYESLVSDIQTYAERSDDPFLSQIPRFIMLAENRIASEIRGLGLVRVVGFNLVSGNPTIEKPARWRETKSFSVVHTRRDYLSPRTYEYCREYNTGDGVPMFYSDYDFEHYYLAKTPDSNYAAELIYHERPEPLSETNQTSWTTRYAPQLLLYASLLEAQPFLKSARMKEFEELYDRAAKSISNEDMSRITDNSVRRT